MLELSTAKTADDFDDVYRFWYDVYVTEMGRHRNDANTSHKSRKLYDPLSTAGSLCIARKDGEVVGTILSTPINHPAVEKYRLLYQLDSLSTEDQWSSAITTKLMVKANMRRTRLPLRLAFASYDWSLHVGMKRGYMDCNDHLLNFFYRLGYVKHLPSLYHADYGQVNSMRLELTDEQHLRKVSSPLLAVLKRFQNEQGLVPEERPQPARSYRRTGAAVEDPAVKNTAAQAASTEQTLTAAPAA